MVKIEEISHEFAKPIEEPPIIVTIIQFPIIFSCLIAGCFLIFIILIARLKLNCEILKKVEASSSLLLLGVVSGIFGIYLWFWVKGNIIDTLKLLGIMIVPLLLSIQKFSKTHAMTK